MTNLVSSNRRGLARLHQPGARFHDILRRAGTDRQRDLVILERLATSGHGTDGSGQRQDVTL